MAYIILNLRVNKYITYNDGRFFIFNKIPTLEHLRCFVLDWETKKKDFQQEILQRDSYVIEEFLVEEITYDKEIRGTWV